MSFPNPTHFPFKSEGFSKIHKSLFIRRSIHFYPVLYSDSQQTTSGPYTGIRRIFFPISFKHQTFVQNKGFHFFKTCNLDVFLVQPR